MIVNYRPRKERGFSLLEILMVLTIIMSVMAPIFFIYQHYNQDNQTLKFQQQFSEFIRDVYLFNENEDQFSIYTPSKLIALQHNNFLKQEDQKFFHVFNGEVKTTVESSIGAINKRNDLFTIALYDLPKHICIQITNQVAAQAWYTFINPRDLTINPYFLVPLTPGPTVMSSGRTAPSMEYILKLCQLQKNTVVFKFYKQPSFLDEENVPVDILNTKDQQKTSRLDFQKARQVREHMFGLIPDLEQVSPNIN